MQKLIMQSWLTKTFFSTRPPIYIEKKSNAKQNNKKNPEKCNNARLEQMLISFQSLRSVHNFP